MPLSDEAKATPIEWTVAYFGEDKEGRLFITDSGVGLEYRGSVVIVHDFAELFRRAERAATVVSDEDRLLLARLDGEGAEDWPAWDAMPKAAALIRRLAASQDTGAAEERGRLRQDEQTWVDTGEDGYLPTVDQVEATARAAPALDALAQAFEIIRVNLGNIEDGYRAALPTARAEPDAWLFVTPGGSRFVRTYDASDLYPNTQVTPLYAAPQVARQEPDADAAKFWLRVKNALDDYESTAGIAATLLQAAPGDGK